MRMPRLATFLCTAACAAACGAEALPSDGVAGPAVTIRVAPLNLPDVVDADWGIRVLNDSGEVVFHRPSLLATAYGDGQSLSFVGPCDASPDEQPNRVELTLNGLVGPLGAILPATYQNPTAALPIFRDVTCVENADVQVTFDVTILRAASQGFFDVAVEFDDLFCSAKLDCSRDVAGTQPIELVFDPDSGARVPTAVLALACTGGVDADTRLYVSDVTIACDTPASYTLDMAGGPGNLYTGAAGANPAPAGAPFVQAQVFRGREQLSDGAGGDYRKLYWNLAVGLDLTDFTASCTLSARATAADGAFTAFATPAGTTYPVIDYAIDPFISAGVRACAQNPLNGSGSDVSTSYTPAAGGVTFAHELRIVGEVGAGVALATFVPPPVPVQATDLVSARASTSCVVVAGQSRCWGENGFRQTGDPSAAFSAAPFTQVNVPVFHEAEAGIHGSCARAGGDVWCWGTASPFPGSNVAVQRAGIATATALEVGDEANCALLANDTVTCWGANYLGQSAGSGLANAVQLAVNDHHGCARLSSGQIRCWGRNNNGQLGKGSASPTCGGGGDTCETAPVAVQGIADAASIAVGHNGACAFRGDGSVWCWGHNANGQLGTGTVTGDQLGPVAATALPSDLIQLDLGYVHACGLTLYGDVYCWGERGFGKIGDGLTSGDALTPYRVDLPGPATEVAVGNLHSCARLTTGAIACWGDDTRGQCGNGADGAGPRLVPVMVSAVP